MRADDGEGLGCAVCSLEWEAEKTGAWTKWRQPNRKDRNGGGKSGEVLYHPSAHSFVVLTEQVSWHMPSLEMQCVERWNGLLRLLV